MRVCNGKWLLSNYCMCKEVNRNGYWSYLYLGSNHIRSNWGNNFICCVKWEVME